jgi:FMN-dependent NADH-azoreductase
MRPIATVGTDPVPPITAAHVIARLTDPAELSAELKDVTALQDQLIDEFLTADAYLFTVPMYNYSVPAAFKAWIDQIVVLGRTLPFPAAAAPTEGRPAVVVSARGGYSPGTPNHDRDFALPWLQLILAHMVSCFGAAPSERGALAGTCTAAETTR